MADEVDPRLIAALLMEERDAKRSGRPAPFQMPEIAPLNPSPEMRSSISPEADRAVAAMGLSPSAGPMIDALLKAEPYTREFTGVPQIQRAGSSVGDLMIDPSIPNATNAAVQTAMAVAKPMAALKMLGAGYASAAAKDFGGSPVSEAEAQTPLTKQQRREMEMERQRAERQADIDRRAAETRAKLDKETEDARMKRDLGADVARKERAEYDRAVANAEQLAAKEIGRDRRFSDTAVGQVYDKTGGLAPALMGLAGAKLSRLATGPGETIGGQIVKDYALPLTTSTITGGITANLPLAYNALATEPDNPKRRMYEALAENLPASHPRRQEAVNRLQDTKALPEANPIRTAASTEFYDPEKLKERLTLGGMEGFGGGLLGTDLIRALARGGKALGGRLAETARGPSTNTLAGTVIDEAPLSSGPGGASTALTKALAEDVDQLPALAASSNQRPTYNGVPLPPGVELRADGYPYDIRTGHPVRKRLFQGRE